MLTIQTMKLHEFYHWLGKAHQQVPNSLPAREMIDQANQLRRLSEELNMNLIDSFMTSSYGETAAASFATASMHNAVALLQDLGAHIDWIGYGYAAGGNTQRAEIMRSLGADINWIALGAAKHGSRDYTERLRSLGANINWIALGASQRQDINVEDEYLTFLIASGADIRWITLGAGLARNRELIFQLLTNHPEINLNLAALGAACSNYLEFAIELVEHGVAHSDWVNFGAALGGNTRGLIHMLQFNHRLQEITPINHTLTTIGAALGGFIYETQSIRTPVDGPIQTQLIPLSQILEIDLPNIEHIIHLTNRIRRDGPEAIFAIMGNAPADEQEYLNRLINYNERRFAAQETLEEDNTQTLSVAELNTSSSLFHHEHESSPLTSEPSSDIYDERDPRQAKI